MGFETACPYCNEEVELELEDAKVITSLLNPNEIDKVYELACWSCGHRFRVTETWQKVLITYEKKD